MTAQSTNGKAELRTKLRAAFPAEAIHKKPQPLKKGSEVGQCDECKRRHGLPAIHIDYVGHAHVTERLLDVDPDYTFEPSARDERGLPLFLAESGGDYGVWAKLTVLGVMHEEYGEGATRKAAWSDVLKRCAMRHGVALDFWKKEANSEETPHEPEPEDTYGPCPRCKQGEIVKRTTKKGQIYAQCSLRNYRDPKTCQWVDWEPDFETYEHCAASKESTDDAPANDAERPAVPPARTNGATRATPQPVPALAEQSGKLPWDE